jgi:hypothetical protein
MKALLTIDHSEGAPKYLVTPEIGGTPTSTVTIDGVGTATMIPYFLRWTINDGDDVNAATSLLAGNVDAREILLDQQDYVINSPEDITHLYWVAHGNTSAGPLTAAPANYTGNAYIIANTETDAADAQAQMCHMTFDVADKVRRVYVTVTPVLATNYAIVTVRGASYA